MANLFEKEGFRVAPRPGMEPRDESGNDVLEDADIDTGPKNLFAQFKQAEPREEQVETGIETQGEPEAKSQETMTQSLRKTRAALTAEGIDIRDNIPEGPERKAQEDDWLNRWSEQNALEREEQLAQRVTFGGETDEAFRNSPQIVRRGEEVLHRLVGFGQATTASIFGNQKKADDITGAMNDLSEYNDLLDRNSIFGKTAGPMIGQIGSSIAQSTAAVAATGGASGVAGMFGLEAFNKGMEEAKDLAPKEQAVHATTKAGIDFFTTLAGGMLAKRANVASGETVIPFMSKISKNIFSAAGLKAFAVKGSKAGFFEGAEEGVQTLLGGMEDFNAGVSGSLDGLFDDTLKAFTTGAFIGNVTELATGGGLSPAMQHVDSLMQGTINRLKKDKPAAAAAIKPNEVKITPEGKTIHTKDLDVELETLQALESEMNEQFESGGAGNLRQSIGERSDALHQNDLDLKDLRMERNKWINMVGKSEDSNKIKNIDRRMKMLEDYKAELTPRVEADNARLAEWETDFKEIHKEERAFFDSELDRLTKLRELPNASEAVLDKLSKPEPASKADPKKEGEAKGDQAGDTTTESTPENDGQPSSQESESTSPTPKAGESRGSSRPVVDAIDSAQMRARQKDQARVRDVLGLDKLSQRESQATDAAFAEASRRGLAEQALDLANQSIEAGTILDSVQLAGVQQRYVGELDTITAMTRELENKGADMTDGQYEINRLQLEESLDTVNRLTEAWSKSASEAGAALQAQQRVYGVAFSNAKTLVQARRNKGEDLSAKEVTSLTEASESVRKASDEITKHEKGTDAYDKADFELSDALMQHTAAVSSLKPSGMLGRAVEAFNAFRMGNTLGGDLPPLFRQGFATLASNPVQAAKNIKSFYKPFMTNTFENVRIEEFKAQRSLREMENFGVLTKKFGVPIAGEHTAFNEVEGTGLQRMSQALATPLKDLAGKVVDIQDKVPVTRQLALTKQRLESGYRVWLNTTRLSMADIAYRTNKEILSKPGGEKEMRQIIDNIMNATGHSVHSLGSAGSVLMTAPRWMISRFEYPAKAMKHVPLGLWDIAHRKKSASNYLAKQYGKSLIGATLLSYGLEGAASVIFGPENVDVDRDPRSKTFGLMRIKGMNFDITGGMGFVIRAANKLRIGTLELARGDDKEKDADFGQSLGGIIGNRTSPIVRDLAFLYQSGKPMGEKEKMALAEYAARGTTFLSWQSTFDALRAEGLSSGAATFIMEMHGASGFPADKKKR